METALPVIAAALSTCLSFPEIQSIGRYTITGCFSRKEWRRFQTLKAFNTYDFKKGT